MINSPPRVTSSGHNTSEVYYKHPSLIWKNAQLIESTEKEVKIKDNENIILTQPEETLPKVFYLLNCTVFVFLLLCIGNFVRSH
jgi:hypothetical protein